MFFLIPVQLELCKRMNLFLEKVNNFKFKKWLQTLEQFSRAQCIISGVEGDPNQLVTALQTASSYLYDCTLLVKVNNLTDRLQ